MKIFRLKSERSACDASSYQSVRLLIGYYSGTRKMMLSYLGSVYSVRFAEQIYQLQVSVASRGARENKKARRINELSSFALIKSSFVFEQW